MHEAGRVSGLRVKVGSLCSGRSSHASDLVAEWIHFALFGIILHTIKLDVHTFWGLMNSATKVLGDHRMLLISENWVVQGLCG